MAGAAATPAIPHLISNQRENIHKSTGGSDFNLGSTEFPPLKASSSSIGNTGVDNHGNGSGKIWSSFFSTSIPSEDCSLERQDSVVMDGNKGVGLSSKNFEDLAKECERLVIGFFAGKKLPFFMVEEAIKNVWKPKSEVTFSTHGPNAYVFNFTNEEDRKFAIEQGAFYIAKSLFIVRPWSLLIEQSVAKMKTIPIWVRIYNVPLHLWNKLGLSSIASFLGNPLMMDEYTKKKTRLTYARVCVEIGSDFSFPSLIPLWIDGIHIMDLPVEYQSKPFKCSSCSSFGHIASACSLLGVTKKSHWVRKKIQNQDRMEEDTTPAKTLQNGVVEHLIDCSLKGNEVTLGDKEDATTNGSIEEQQLQGKGSSIKPPANQAMNVSSILQGPDIEAPTLQTPNGTVVNGSEQQVTLNSAGKDNGIELAANGDGTWTVYSSKKKKYQKNNPSATTSNATSSCVVPTIHLSPFLDLDDVGTSAAKDQGLPLICESVLENEDDSTEYETDNESMGVGKIKEIKEINCRRPLNRYQKMDMLKEAGFSLGIQKGKGYRETEANEIFSGIIGREPKDDHDKPKFGKALEQIKWEGVTNNSNYGRGKRTPLKKG